MVPVRTLHIVLGRDDEQVSHAFLSPEVKTGEWNRMWGLHMEDTVFQTWSLQRAGRQYPVLLSTSAENLLCHAGQF